MYKLKADDLLPIAGWCIAIPALQAKEPVKQPNIVIILADDLGFGICIPPKVHEGYWVAPMELGRGEETQQFQVKKEMRLWKTDSIFLRIF